jgi:hypothetical protein
VEKIMPNNEAQSCWEFWDCEAEIRDECPAYIKNMGQQCWLLGGTPSDKPYCPKRKRDFKICQECTWFKKLNPDLA